MRKCKNCEYYAKDFKIAGVNAGICKLNPPVPIPFFSPAGINIQMIYPAVKENEWCGQFSEIIGINRDITLKIKTDQE